MKRVSKIRRMRIPQRIRKTVAKLRYEVEVIIKEKKVRVFADTAADTCVMSKKEAKRLGLPLGKTKMKIRPYDSRSIKYCGCYVGTIMYGDTVVNICIFMLLRCLLTQENLNS